MEASKATLAGRDEPERRPPCFFIRATARRMPYWQAPGYYGGCYAAGMFGG